MFNGPLLPLSPEVPLSQLLGWARPGTSLGAWVRAGVSRLHLYRISRRSGEAGSLVLASSSLGLLLGRCSEVALRQAGQSRVLSAEVIIRWRALQVVTATPHLPGIQRLRAQFPNITISVNGLLIPTCLDSPEEVLARCVAEGVAVSASRIVYECVNGEDLVLK